MVEHRLMHVEAVHALTTERREQGRVCVHHPTKVLVDHEGGEHPQIAGEDDQIDLVLLKTFYDVCLVLFPSDAFVRERECVYPMLARALQSVCLRYVGYHNNNIAINLTTLAGIDDGLKIRPAARSQNPDPYPAHSRPTNWSVHAILDESEESLEEYVWFRIFAQSPLSILGASKYLTSPFPPAILNSTLTG